MGNSFALNMGLMIFGVVIAALSQIILKKAAMKHYDTWLKQYLNAPVIIAYFIFFVSSLCSVTALKVLPLTLALPGLLRRRLYTYRWMSLLVWLYFIEGVVRASGDRGLSAQLALLELTLTLTLFAACALHVRARLRNAKEALA